MTRGLVGLRKVGILAFIATVMLVMASSVVAARASHQRWPTMHEVLRKAGLHSLRRRTGRAGVLSPRARASIVGGSQISITQAPWQVFVVSIIPLGPQEALFLLCGGSIIDETHVVTAGHCLFDPENGSRVPAGNVFVVAGTSNFSRIETGEQEIEAAGVRVHPDFEYASGPGATDDVAVLELAHSLTFDTLVQPIRLVTAGATPAEGIQVDLTGFGRETSTSPSEGPLNSLGMTVGFSRPCGGEADAVFLCASASGGSGCEGDSGSGLTEAPTPVLVGVMDTVVVISGEACRPTATNGFVNTAAPEIHDFIEGDEDPPIAPRGGGIGIRARTRVGNEATCESGSWNGSPTFAYKFLNSANSQVLQAGPSSTYQLTEADLGMSISCEVSASNAGGTGVARTNALPSITEAEEQAPGPGAPYEAKVSPEAIESGNESAARTLKEWEAAQAAQERTKREEAEALERAQREAKAGEAGNATASAQHCIVPWLKGDSLSKARRVLSKAHCKLGKVTRLRGRSSGQLVVTRQGLSPGKKLAVNAPVGVSMGRASLRTKKQP